MSLFLGKIHYWLFNKIQWAEALEEEIIQNFQGRDILLPDLIRHMHQQFGAPMEKKSLEEMIDTGNIHGWLQQRIESVELRQAALVTEILNWRSSNKEELVRIFSDQGAAAAKEYNQSAGTPEDVFHALNDFILEGMPCDRVNEIVENNEKEFSWETIRCLHKAYWERIGGNVGMFYVLREAWIKSFVETMDPQFQYSKENGVNRIIRKV